MAVWWDRLQVAGCRLQVIGEKTNIHIIRVDANVAVGTGTGTTSASVQEQHQQLALDLPALFALQTHGFALNIGPKLMWMAMDNYRQTVNNTQIDAYYPAYKVHVYNQPSTGVLATQKGKSMCKT